MHWNSLGCFGGRRGSRRDQHQAGSLAALLKLLEEGVAGIENRPVKLRGNVEERQEDYELRRMKPISNTTLRDQRPWQMT